MRSRILFLSAVVLTLVGCGASRKDAVRIEPPPPVDAKCDVGEVKCSGACPALPEWKLRLDAVTGELFGDFDELEVVAIQDAEVLKACEAKLRACQACIDRLKAEGVIRD